MNTLILIRCLMCWMYILHGSFTSAVLNSPCEPGSLGMQDGRISRSQISATGFSPDHEELDNIRYTGECCNGAKGKESGLCFNTTEPKKTVTVDFLGRVQLSVVKLQCPSNCSVGFVKTFKLRYEDVDGAIKLSGSKTGYNGLQEGQGEISLNLPMKTFVKKVHIDITDFKGQPCLRLEFVGCLEAEVCTTRCDKGGKCMSANYCECFPNYTPPGKCNYQFPNMTYSPTLQVVDARQGNTVTFKCTIPILQPGMKHRAYWYVDLGNDRTEWLHNGSDTSSAVVSEINEQEIYDRLEKLESIIKGLNWEVKCNVTACYDSQCGNAASPPMSSNAISAKATLDRTTIVVVKGEGAETVGVKLHGPPVLFFFSGTKMSGSKPSGNNIVIEAVFDTRPESCTSSGHVPAVHANDNTQKHCGPDVTSDNWNTHHTITIKAVRDELRIVKNVTRKCTINLKHVDRSGTVVSSTVLGELTVNVQDMDNWADAWKKPSQCKAYTDPHIRTFDGTQFLLPLIGEYVLYRNRNHGIQVNIKLVDCGNLSVEHQGYVGISCTCAVAIKVRDDVIVLGSCPRYAVNSGTQQGSGSLHFRVSMFLNGESNDKMKRLTAGTRIYRDRDGRNYFVYLPSGTSVQVKPNWIRNRFLDVAINPSLSDREHSDGICGFYDGKCAGDLRDANNIIYNMNNGNDCGYISKPGYNDFANKWKVEKDSCESLMNGVPAKTTTTPAQVYCRCAGDSNDCGPHKDIQQCPPSYGYTDITYNVTTQMSFPPKTFCLTRRKRSLDGFLQLSKRSVPVIDSDEDVYQSVVFSESYVPRNPTWPTPSGWTEATARKYCKDFLDKTSVQNCKSFMNTSFEDEVNSCIFDIKATDSTVFARAVLKLILGECLSEIMKYPVDIAELPGNITRAALYDSLCLDNCSNNGVCKNGQCECHPGFYGSVCGMTKDIPPTITYLSRDGLCNIRSRNCTKSEIFGSGHIRSGDLKCRVTPYEPSIGVRDDKNQFTTSAIYIDFNMLVCPHNNKTGAFMIAVSNDNGKTYSNNELLFLAYDSFCFKCSIDQNKKRRNCTQLEATCVIKGGCFLAGALHSEDECKICDPGRDLKRWSVNSVLSKCIKTATPPVDNSLVILVGIIAGIAVIATAIIAVMMHKICAWKKMIHPSKGDIDDKCNDIDGKDVHDGSARNGHDSKNLAYTKEY